MHILSLRTSTRWVGEALASGMAGREEEEEGGPIKPGQMRDKGPHDVPSGHHLHTLHQMPGQGRGAKGLGMGSERECFSTNVGSSWSAGRFLG